jgi:hypothetical protein
MRMRGTRRIWVGALGAMALAVPWAAEAATFTHYTVAPAITSAYDPYAAPIDGGDLHQIYVPDLGPGAHDMKLLVFLHGRGASPQQYDEFLRFAARRSFYVIGLSYPTPGSPTMCKGLPNEPACFGAVRHEITFGHPSAGVAGIDIASHPEESLANRLRALLVYLRAQHPDEGWSHFIVDTLVSSQPKWAAMVLAGHSAGSGFAAYLGREFSVRRVIMFAGTADAPDWLPLQSADWITQPTQTPPERYFGLVHTNDLGPPTMTVSRVAKVLENWDTFGLPGAPTSMDGGPPPYSSNRLITSRCLDAHPFDAVPCTLQSPADAATAAHNAFIGDGPENDLYAPAWSFLLH